MRRNVAVRCNPTGPVRDHWQRGTSYASCGGLRCCGAQLISLVACCRTEAVRFYMVDNKRSGVAMLK